MGGLRYTKAPRSVRYPLYVEQVLCTQAYVDRILRAIDGNTNLRDAVVIIHGDHGSRIGYNDRDHWIEEGGSIGEFERDWRAALLAVPACRRNGSHSRQSPQAEFRITFSAE